MINILNIVKNPVDYYKKAKYLLVGWYFDVFYKKIKIDGLQFILPSYGNDRAGRGLMFLNQYEEPERILLKKCVAPSAKVLELGACIGVVSCTTNKMLQNPENHVVVEANPLLINTLTENRDANKCKFKITNVLISPEKENDFYIGDNMVASSLIAKNGRKVTVAGVSFQDIEQEYNIEFDTLIMDIEGAEYNIIKNNIDFIKKLKVVFMENHPFLLSKEQIEEYESLLIKNTFIKTHELSPVTIWERK